MAEVLGLLWCPKLQDASTVNVQLSSQTLDDEGRQYVKEGKATHVGTIKMHTL